MTLFLLPVHFDCVIATFLHVYSFWFLQVKLSLGEGRQKSAGAALPKECSLLSTQPVPAGVWAIPNRPPKANLFY